MLSHQQIILSKYLATIDCDGRNNYYSQGSKWKICFDTSIQIKSKATLTVLLCGCCISGIKELSTNY